MVKVVYVDSEGAKEELDVPEGWNLMQAAVTNGIDGIEGECGGSCCCATCHVYIDEAFLDKIPAMSEAEDNLLNDTVSERKPNSRLACQITATTDLEGIVVQMPEAQS